MSNLTTAEKCTMRDLANPELSVEFSTASKVMAEATAIIERLDQALMQTPQVPWTPTAQALPEEEHKFLRQQPHKMKFWIHSKLPEVQSYITFLVYRVYREGKWEWVTRLDGPRLTITDSMVTNWMAVIEPQAPQNT